MRLCYFYQFTDSTRVRITADVNQPYGRPLKTDIGCCKHIADRLELVVSPNADMPELVKATLKGLQLVPEDIAEEKKGAQVIKRILRNFAQLTHGLAELRNLYGSGHGRNSSYRGLQPRHARLAVSAAAAFIEFVVATFNMRTTRTNEEIKTRA